MQYGRTGRFCLKSIVPLPLISSRCATWLLLTGQSGLGVVELVERFLKLFQAFQLLCGMLDVAMTSSHIMSSCVAGWFQITWHYRLDESSSLAEWKERSPETT